MPMFKDDTGTDSLFSLDEIDTPQSRRVDSTILVDLRRSPRVAVSIPVEISLQGERRILAMVTNLSSSGLRLEGGVSLVDALFDGDVLQDDHKSTRAEFRFQVPDDAGSDAAVVVQGRTVYARRDDGSYQVGVEFKGFSQGRDALHAYLTSRGARQ